MSGTAIEPASVEPASVEPASVGHTSAGGQRLTEGQTLKPVV